MQPFAPPADLCDLLVRSSPDGVFAMDREGRYLAWNPTMERVLGMKADAVIGKNAFELFPYLVELGERDRFEATLRGESCVSPLRPFETPDGKTSYFENYYSPLRDSGGTIIGLTGIVRDVTERAQREASGHLFETIAESIPHLVWIYRDDYTLEYFNQRWYDYTGMKKVPRGEEIRPDESMSYIHPDDRALVIGEARRANESGTPFQAEYRLRSRSGTYRWFLGRGIGIRGPGGNLIKMLGTATDIDDQKITSQELQTSIERFRALVEQMPFAFQLYSLDGLCTYANPAWETIWLSKRDDLKNYNILKDPHTQKFGIHDLMQRAFRGEAVTFPDVLYDPALIGKVGRPRWVRTHFFPIHDAQGSLTQIAEMVEDVTAQHLEHERDAFLSEASKLLGESLEVDRTLGNIAKLCANRIADYCIIDLLDSQGQIRRVEIATAEQTDFSRDLVQKIRAFPPQITEPDYPPLVALLEQRTVHIENFDEDYVKKSSYLDERKRIMLSNQTQSLMSIPLIARGHSLGVMTVLTTKRSLRVFTRSEISWLEEIAERTAIAIDNANLYRSSKQAVIARDTFMSTASHELKTPLTALQLQLGLVGRLLSLAAQDSEVADRVRKFQLQTDRQIRRLSRLVDDMLDISRIASGRLKVEPESMDLAALTSEVCERLQPLAGDFETSLKFEPDGPVFGEWDGHRIEQVLNNLLTNAFRYGGKDPIEIQVWEKGDHAYISVRDRGRGIAKEDHERIFQRYERGVGDEAPAGFGLGLYIAREIVALHQGSIRVESELGQGATFTVELPLHPQL